MENVEVVATGLRFPEGPVVLADGSVLVAEIARGTVTRVEPDGRVEIVKEVGGGPNGLAIGPDRALFIANNGGRFTFSEQGGLLIPGHPPAEHRGGAIQRLDLASGELRTLYDACDGERLQAPNDLVFDCRGGFYFTDHGYADREGLKWGALYYARADGSEIRLLAGHFVSPNGVGLSPGRDVVYMADTALGRLWAFDLAEPGVLGPPPPMHPARVVATMPDYQLFDSLAVEEDGRVCVATIINGGITAVAPDGTTEHHPYPDPIVTNIAFGGADMRDAWITASGTGALVRARWPRPGLKLAHDG
ncbi:MAG: gluconolactonase, putative [uncultured Sphingomonadaceae bacterium]|uniref:Gluconolactonase, putative n=1 Tax=uncultured Sphingomonadaceae bacterium TaxID=169976 RepID=A0A6J4SW88_9SPHN|nr:MAG: gluconolactonase, putative [uncultured Sphingomonadaceae bacterium]